MISILLVTIAVSLPPQAPATDTYSVVLARVLSGETLTVYAGVGLPTVPEPNAVRVDSIPGEPAGVYRCWRERDLPVMRQTIALPVAGRLRRVSVGQYWYDLRSDGVFVWCTECNRGR